MKITKNFILHYNTHHKNKVCLPWCLSANVMAWNRYLISHSWENSRFTSEATVATEEREVIWKRYRWYTKNLFGFEHLPGAHIQNWKLSSALEREYSNMLLTPGHLPCYFTDWSGEQRTQKRNITLHKFYLVSSSLYRPVRQTYLGLGSR